MDFARPGPEHERLKRLTGAWTAKIVQYRGPNAAPDESNGEFLARMDLGGYYMRREMNFGMLGFQGAGLTGWDPFQRSYVGVWVDSTSPIMSRSEGQFDERGVFCETSVAADASGAVLRVRLTTHVIDPNQMLFRMYRIDEGGGESLILSIDHTRRRFV